MKGTYYPSRQKTFTKITLSISMPNTFIDKAYAVVPEFENRISRFDKKLRIAQYWNT